jgi:hypothetical protein
MKINARYRKLTGMHAGHVYAVAAPASEIDSPMRWVLHGETVADETLIVAENELTDTARWQPAD